MDIQCVAIFKNIKLGRLETSEDFITKKVVEPKTAEVKFLKISVRELSEEDIRLRKLPEDTAGVVITKIEKNSPINYLDVNNIIVEVQKKKIKSINDLEKIVNDAFFNSS